MGLIQDLWQTSRAGGGEGWFGMQPEFSGIGMEEANPYQTTGRSKTPVDYEPGPYTELHPQYSEEKKFRGILGALNKLKLQRQLEQEAGVTSEHPASWDPGSYSVTPEKWQTQGYVDEDVDLPRYTQKQAEYNRESYSPDELYPQQSIRDKSLETKHAASIYGDYYQSPKNILDLIMGALGQGDRGPMPFIGSKLAPEEYMDVPKRKGSPGFWMEEVGKVEKRGE